MSLFIEELSNEYCSYRNIVIMDKAGWHTTNYLKSFDNVRYIYLPPYSPELNPAEHLWETIRNMKFRNTTYNSLNEVQDALIDSFEFLDNNKEQVSKLTYFKWINLDI
jgi:transposase